jgi:hypothetical protein
MCLPDISRVRNQYLEPSTNVPLAKLMPPVMVKHQKPTGLERLMLAETDCLSLGCRSFHRKHKRGDRPKQTNGGRTLPLVLVP